MSLKSHSEKFTILTTEYTGKRKLKRKKTSQWKLRLMDGTQLGTGLVYIKWQREEKGNCSDIAWQMPVTPGL